jgi:hypothetical protein
MKANAKKQALLLEHHFSLASYASVYLISSYGKSLAWFIRVRQAYLHNF